jgi:hypothetical protein
MLVCVSVAFDELSATQPRLRAATQTCKTDNWETERKNTQEKKENIQAKDREKAAM